MTDKLKDKIEKFLTMCRKSKAKTEQDDDNAIKVDTMTEDLHSELAADAVAITSNLMELQRLLPLSRKLADLGRLLESQGKITLQADEAYDEAALKFFSELYGGGISPSKALHRHIHPGPPLLSLSFRTCRKTAFSGMISFPFMPLAFPAAPQRTVAMQTPFPYGFPHP